MTQSYFSHCNFSTVTLTNFVIWVSWYVKNGRYCPEVTYGKMNNSLALCLSLSFPGQMKRDKRFKGVYTGQDVWAARWCMINIDALAAKASERGGWKNGHFRPIFNHQTQFHHPWKDFQRVVGDFSYVRISHRMLCGENCCVFCMSKGHPCYTKLPSSPKWSQYHNCAVHIYITSCLNIWPSEMLVVV